MSNKPSQEGAIDNARAILHGIKYAKDADELDDGITAVAELLAVFIEHFWGGVVETRELTGGITTSLK